MNGLMVKVLIAVLSVGAGAAVAGESSDDAIDPKVEKACFRVRDTRSFEAIDDRFVYVRCVRNKHYLLTMENVCMGLENSTKVAISNDFDRVCSNDRAMITYRDFNQRKRCGILTVESVKDRDAALELVKERRKPTDKEGTKEEE